MGARFGPNLVEGCSNGAMMPVPIRVNVEPEERLIAGTRLSRNIRVRSWADGQPLSQPALHSASGGQIAVPIVWNLPTGPPAFGESVPPAGAA